VLRLFKTIGFLILSSPLLAQHVSLQGGVAQSNRIVGQYRDTNADGNKANTATRDSIVQAEDQVSRPAVAGRR
jgi:hypothetical protein